MADSGLTKIVRNHRNDINSATTESCAFGVFAATVKWTIDFVIEHLEYSI